MNSIAKIQQWDSLTGRVLALTETHDGSNCIRFIPGFLRAPLRRAVEVGGTVPPWQAAKREAVQVVSTTGYSGLDI